MSIIHASSFFHLFNREDQIRVACVCVELLKKTPGSLVFGRQIGNRDAGVRSGQPAHAGCTGPVREPEMEELATKEPEMEDF